MASSTRKKTARKTTAAKPAATKPAKAKAPANEAAKPANKKAPAKSSGKPVKSKSAATPPAKSVKTKPAATPPAKPVKSKAAPTKSARTKPVARKAALPAAKVRLTAEVTAGGCAGKLGPADLRGALSRVARLAHPNVLVGNEHADDAGVYRISKSLAMVCTVDFFPPMVDDPFVFGQIAAANALSDVYAMGGTPLTALGITAFPCTKLPLDVLVRIMEGAQERVTAAGAVIIGGHSVSDDQLKYGLAVTGTVHPDRIVRNGGARPGDALVLTKALGTGIICSGIKQRVAHADEEAFAISSMITLNDIAGSLLHRFGARACTDVTGFGLVGHATEMAEASGQVRLEIDSTQLTLLPGAARLAEDGYLTGGARRTREWLGRRLHVAKDVAPALREAVADPQTSGGLLVSLPLDRAEAYVDTLHRRGLRPSLIGRVVARPRTSAVVVSVS